MKIKIKMAGQAAGDYRLPRLKGESAFKAATGQFCDFGGASATLSGLPPRQSR
ncbi:MAG TPA: hypothetical protein VGL72_08545 [Bryobacteraceae bacterium]